MSRARKPQPRSEWIPLASMKPTPWTDAKRAALRADAEARGYPDVDGFLAAAEEEHATAEVWGNDRYLVHVTRREDGSVHNLSLRRTDRKPLRDWRDMQRIKNELAGYDVEAVELFPADDRLMDSANQYWMWCLPVGQTFPFGFPGGLVDSTEVAGSRQRPIGDDSYTRRELGSLSGATS